MASEVAKAKQERAEKLALLEKLDALVAMVMELGQKIDRLYDQGKPAAQVKAGQFHRGEK